MIHLDGRLETDDLTFAVVLALNGFHPVMERRERAVFWTVGSEELDENMDSFLNSYLSGNLLVEPRRFAREWAAMRKDLYRLMEVDGKAQGARVRPSK
jgi:hypothetical protein